MRPSSTLKLVSIRDRQSVAPGRYRPGLRQARGATRITVTTVTILWNRRPGASFDCDSPGLAL
jgi:hypothetical protein